jgi:hypothetical protein
MNKVYPFLLASLMAAVVAAPLSASVGRHGELVEVLLMFSLGVSALGEVAARRKWLLLILFAAVVLKATGVFFGIGGSDDAGTLIAIVLAGFAALRAFRYALGANEVDTDHICAALSVYMLAGFFFGTVYWKMEGFWPGSFAPDSRIQGVHTFDLPSAIYFSFISIATVGYGDIVPVHPVARGVVVTEAILGQFYMVVLVARLVSLYSQKRGPTQK